MARASRLIKQTKILLLAALLLPVTSAGARGIDCAECHQDVTIESPAHPDLVCVDCHTNVTAEHEGKDLDPLTDREGCSPCHKRPYSQIGRSAHAGEVTCNQCHGDSHAIHMAANLASKVSAVNQIEHCGACHDEPADLVEGYKNGAHGQALLSSGLVDAPGCSSCHGSHLILGINEPRAAISHVNAPETCGTCHALLLEDWKSGSAHGLAWEDGEEGPVCTDCHSSHESADLRSAESRLASADSCGGCHESQLATFRQGFHGKANNLGLAAVANCADCHTPHQNLAAGHPRSSVHPDNLMATCGSCHEGISQSFTSYDPHSEPGNPDDNYIVYVVWISMIGLLIGVFGFFGVHDLLWLQRSLVGVLRGEYERHGNGSSTYVRRFSKAHTSLHLVIIVTFLLLALTGLPLKFHETAWAQTLTSLLGGLESTRIIHRVAAVGTFGYALYHLGELFVRWAIQRERGLFWGPDSMVPQPGDFTDLVANVRHFLYLGERPKSDRWSYIEKFDYLAVFWGVMMIGASGVMLWAPIWFTGFLPGWTLNVAYVVHSDEALLATGFIFVFHFFHTHLRPGSFPMDPVIFTGKMSLERFKEERHLEYQRLVYNGELEKHFVDPPTRAQRRVAYLLGSLFLFLGVSMAIGIIAALLKG